MTEDQLVDAWIPFAREQGLWVLDMRRMGAVLLPGFPDLIIGRNRVTFVEAKRRKSKKTALHPGQLTTAQHFILGRVVACSGNAAVLTLEPGAFAMIDYRDLLHPFTGAEFDAAKEAYPCPSP